MRKLRTTYLSLGSNLGNKIYNLQKALDTIYLKIGNVSKVSSVYKTASWGFSGDDFYNICIEVETNLLAHQLLEGCLKIEEELGRKQKSTNGYQNRIIDIDILLFNDDIIISEKLTVPHQKMLDRKFVLIPLIEIAPNITHPIKKVTIVNALENCNDGSEIVKIKEQLKKPISLKDKYNYITIEGNIGSGKTTLAKMISKDFNAKLILERFAENPFLPKFYEQKERYSFPLEMSFLTDRYIQINEGLSQFNLFKNFIVSDYHIFKSLIFAKITLKKEEFQLYRKIFDIMHKEIVKPDLYVYLYQKPERLIQNIKKRGRAFEQKIDVGYLEMINNGYLTYIKSTKNLNFVIIDVSNLDFVKNIKDYNLILNKMKSI